jgi:hypothetical protein
LTTELRRLTDEGMTLFSDSIAAVRSGSLAKIPFDALEDNKYSVAISNAPFVEHREFVSRFEMGEYLVDVLSVFEWQEIAHDAELWSWLALYYFDQLCPADATGKRKPSMAYQYVLSRDYRHHSRHALRTTCEFVRQYGSIVQFMFSKSPSERGEIIEQLSARQEIAACPGVIEAASALYDDSTRGTFKRGAAGRGRGSIVRLIKVLQQYQLTYDLYSVTGQQLVDMLPAEFDRFRGDDGKSNGTEA